MPRGLEMFMDSHVVCSCGLRFRVSGSSVASPKRCPVCGRSLITPSASGEVPLKKRTNPRTLAFQAGWIGLVGIVLIGMLGGVFLLLRDGDGAQNPETPSSRQRPVVARTTPAPSRVDPETSTDLRPVDRQMLPTGRIGGLNP